MPTGHYPFGHRGFSKVAVWSWASKPAMAGWTDNWASGDSLYAGKFSNTLIPDYITHAEAVKNISYQLTGPTNFSLPGGWEERFSSNFLEPGRPPYGAGLISINQKPGFYNSLTERPRRRNLDNLFHVSYHVYYQGGAFQTVSPFSWVRFSTHWIYNTLPFDEPFADGNYYSSVDPDPAKTIVSDALPTILRPGDETFLDEPINQITTGYRFTSSPLARPTFLQRSVTPVDPGVDAYYTNMFNSIETYMASLSTVEMVLRMAAIPATWPGNVSGFIQVGDY